MGRIVSRRLPPVITIAVALHLVWALGLANDRAAHDATAVHALLLLTSSAPRAALILAVVAIAALLGCTWWRSIGRIPARAVSAVLILPQQMLLIMSSTGAVNAMLSASFADGVIRPRWFIIVDQIPVVLITIGHFATLAHMARYGDG